MGKLCQHPNAAICVLALSLPRRTLVEALAIRALLAFAIPTLIEFSQGLYYRVASGHYVGSFDPLDILMYALGVGLAVLVEQLTLAKLFTPGNQGIKLNA